MDIDEVAIELGKVVGCSHICPCCVGRIRHAERALREVEPEMLRLQNITRDRYNQVAGLQKMVRVCLEEKAALARRVAELEEQATLTDRTHIEIYESMRSTLKAQIIDLERQLAKMGVVRGADLEVRLQRLFDIYAKWIVHEAGDLDLCDAFDSCDLPQIITTLRPSSAPKGPEREKPYSMLVGDIAPHEHSLTITWGHRCLTLRGFESVDEAEAVGRFLCNHRWPEHAEAKP